MSRLTGSSVRRVEDPRLLAGRGRYVDDIGVPGLLHAAFVRSPWPHARLAGVDTDAARAAPGVAAVLTGDDLRRMLTGPMQAQGPASLATPSFWPLATDRARFVGDPVAVVVATSRAVAEDACDLIVVHGEALAPVATIDHALDPARPALFEDTGSNVMQHHHAMYGDIDGAFGRADAVVQAAFVSDRQGNVPLESRAIIADWDAETGTLTCHAAHQNPHTLRAGLAALLGLATTDVRVLCDDIGGSFGQKAYVSREEVAVAAAALHLGRPVKWIEDRVENLLAAGQARDERIGVEAAVSRQGDLLGLRVQLVLDQGAYQLTTLPSSIYPTIIRVLLPGPYRLRHLAFDTIVVATNKATYVPFRGPWASETWVRERLFDLIAAELGLDPVDVRRRNLLTDTELEAGSVTGVSLHAVTARATLDRAAARIGYDAFRAEQPVALAKGRYVGIGVATFIEPSPGPPEYARALGAGASPRTAQQAVARLEGDGSVTVITSQSPHGQGHETTLAQLAADELGLPLERVTVLHGDTDLTPVNLVGTGGSRAATLASGAVMGATADLRSRIAAIAADLLEANAGDIDVEGGRAGVRGTPVAAVTLADVARAAPELQVTHDYAIPDGGWSQATHACTVEVDVETGLVRILRYVVVEDCGRLVNPAVVDGQILGGVVQGIGGVLHELAAYDPEGQPVATTMLDYLLPTALDIPPVEIEHLESPPQGPVDFRGVGEGGAIGAPAALTNAIADALRPLGVRITERHLPPARLLELLGAIPARP